MLADRIEAEKAGVVEQIGKASGLKKLALQQRLQCMERIEQEMCERLAAANQPEQLAAPTAPIEAGQILVKQHARRKATVSNGHNGAAHTGE